MIITRESNYDDWSWLSIVLSDRYSYHEEKSGKVDAVYVSTIVPGMSLLGRAMMDMYHDMGVKVYTDRGVDYGDHFRRFEIVDKDKFMRAKLSR